MKRKRKSNICREGKTLIKQLKRISRLKTQNTIRKEEKIQKWREEKHLRKFKE